MFQAVPKALPEEMRGSIWEHIYVLLSRDDPKMTATSCIILGSTQDKHSASLWTKLEIWYLFKQARHSSCFHSFQSMMFSQAESRLKALTPTWGSWSMASLDQWWVSSDEVSICRHLWGKQSLTRFLIHQSKCSTSTSAVKVLSLPGNLQKLTLKIRLVYASKLMLNSSVVLQLSWTTLESNKSSGWVSCLLESSVDKIQL